MLKLDLYQVYLTASQALVKYEGLFKEPDCATQILEQSWSTTMKSVNKINHIPKKNKNLNLPPLNFRNWLLSLLFYYNSL